jgi:hypothetical protein
MAPLKGKKDVEHQLRYLALEVNYQCTWASQSQKKALDLVKLIEKEEHSLKN